MRDTLHVGKFSVHLCFFDEEARDVFNGSRCWRVHLNTPWLHFAFALLSSGRFARINKRSTWTTLRLLSPDRWLW